MKKQFFLFCAMAMMLVMPQQMMADIEINEFTFPDENFRDYVWLHCDKDHDYVLTDEELLAVKKITITGNSDSDWASITSLNGIKNFISLEELTIGLSTQLSSIDVSGCTSLKKMNILSQQGLLSINASGCSALSILFCNNSQLTTLDVSGCSALGRLECEKNQLTSLDVSECTALTEFRCNNNQLTSLDLSNNTALEYLNCYDNQLTSLDVSQNTALTELWCDKNQLTALNVSNNTALTRLFCGDNPLSSLDVSKNTALEYLYCSKNQLTSLDVSKNTALTELDCFSNELTTLDVSQNTALTTLNCYYNQLTSLDVSNNTALTELDCFSNELTTLDVSKNILLTKLACKGNQLTTLDVSQNTELTELNCSDCQLTSLNVSGCTALTWLTCSGNKLTSLDVSDCKKLNYLYVELNRISMEAMDALIESLPKKNANESGGSFYALDSYNENFYGDLSYLPEMNFLTKEQVAAAKKKGWKTYKNYKEYEGSEDLTGLLFTAKTKEGVDVIYQVTDATEKLCQVGVETATNRIYFAVEPQTTTLEIPEEVNGYKVTAIGADAFSNCEKLKNITIPNSVTTIGKYAFRGCNSLESIIIPSTVEDIGSLAFGECNNLRTIYSEIVDPFDIDEYVFKGYDYDTYTFTNTPIYTEATLYVPEGSKEKYESAQGWNLFANIVEKGIGTVEEGQSVVFRTEINENTDLYGYIFDHVYICISSGDGSYNAAEDCIVLTKPTDDFAIDGKDIFGEDFKDGYTGIVFKVPSGEGTVKVEAATTGNMVLKVKIGSNEPIAKTVEGKQILSYPYTVSEDTYVYIYGGMNAVGAKGMKKAAGEDALKIYGIEVTSETNGIKDIKNERLKMKDSPVYNLNGQRVISSPSGRPGGVPTKGVYIINGKKMVVK